MSVNTFSARPARKSVGAAGVGLLVTLAIFVVVFVAFLIAPLILLGVAFLAYLVMRPRQARTELVQSGDAPAAPGGFGTGTR